MTDRPTSSDSIEAAIHSAVAGDRSALARVLEHHTSVLQTRIAPDVPTRHQAVFAVEDILQLTFTDVFLSIERFEDRGPGAFLAWVTALARRNLQDAIRLCDADKRGGGRLLAKPVSPTSSRSTLLQRVAATTSTPSHHLAQHEAETLLARSLAALPQLHRTVVELTDLQGMAAEEVARFVDRSAGAVYMLRARAHRWLGEMMLEPATSR
jgi:RNA polymerase sigma factor (sigma-70 family)